MTDPHEHDEHAGPHGSHRHPDGEVDWRAMAESIELQGEVLRSILDQAVALVADQCRGEGVAVGRIVDIGSGPGVGTTVLAEAFDRAEVVAVDGSEAMTARAEARFERLGLAGRVRAVTAELPAGLVPLGPVQIVWAAMVMHHLGDERSVLRSIRSVLEPGGRLVLLEFGDPMRFVPEDVEVGPPGLLDRIDALGDDWLGSMRHALPDATASDAYPAMLAEAGFEMTADQLIVARIEAPVGEDERAVIINHLGRLRDLVAPRLDAADAAALDVLLDPDAPLGIQRRRDIVLEWSRHLYVARATAGGGPSA